jgi:hypothetical protein
MVLASLNERRKKQTNTKTFQTHLRDSVGCNRRRDARYCSCTLVTTKTTTIKNQQQQKTTKKTTILTLTCVTASVATVGVTLVIVVAHTSLPVAPATKLLPWNVMSAPAAGQPPTPMPSGN